MILPSRLPDPRLDACLRYGVTDPGASPDLDGVCRLVAGALHLEHVAVVLSAAGRSWVQAAVGWSPRDLGPVAAEQRDLTPDPLWPAGALLQRPDLDALLGGESWGAVSAAPLLTPGGTPLGVLVAASRTPRDWAGVPERLTDGAALIIALLEGCAASVGREQDRQEHAALARRLDRAILTARTFQAIADLTALPLDEDDGLRGAAQLTAQLIGVDWAGVQFTPGDAPQGVDPWAGADPVPLTLPPGAGADPVVILDAGEGWTLPGGEPAAVACADVPGGAARLAFVRRGPAARWTAPDRQVLRDLVWALRHLLSFAAQRSALRGLEDQLQFALRSIPMILWVTDARGALVVAEGSALRGVPLRREQVLGHTIAEVLGDTLTFSGEPEDRGGGPERRQQVTLAGRVYDTHRVPLPRGGGTLGVAFDVTELVESRAQALQAQRHAETLLELTQVMGLSGSLPDVVTQALEVLLRALPGSWLVLWTREDARLRPLVSRGEQPEAIAQWQRQGVALSDTYARQLLAGETVQLDPVDVPPGLRDLGLHGALLLPVHGGDTLTVLGAYRREPLAWSPFERRLLSVAARVVQVSLERRDILAELSSAAVTDPLTGLGNRRAFEADLRAALDRGPLTLVTLDVDGLKQVNDTEGHARGDELLRAVARILGDVLGHGEGSVDRAYRVGGDEFCLLLPGPAREVPSLEAALRDLPALGFPQAGASAGVARAPLDGQHPEVLWQVADERMYVEKARRRRRYRPRSDDTGG